MTAMSDTVFAALIMGLLALVGVCVNAWQAYKRDKHAAKKDDVDVLRGIMNELRSRMKDIEDDNADLRSWAACLCNQIVTLGHIPVPFERHANKTTPAREGD